MLPRSITLPPTRPGVMPPKSKLAAEDPTRSARDSTAGDAQAEVGGAKLKPEDFVEALLDHRVLEALTKALTPLRVAIEAAMDKKLESLGATLRALKADNGRLSDQCKALVVENTDMKKQLVECGRRVEELERYSRCDNLIIRGLPETTSAEIASAALPLQDGATLRDSHRSVEASVISFVKEELKIDILPSDISTAHRIKAGPKDASRPVIVRFTNRRVRNLIYGAKKLLKGTTSRAFISEHLIKADSDLFFEARKLLREKKTFASWTQHGLVHVRFSSDPSTRATVVRTQADLALRS